MALRLPSLEELQQVVDLVTGGGQDYRTLALDVRLRIVEVSIQADINNSMALLTELKDSIENLPIAFAELEPFMTLAAKFAQVDVSLSSIAADTDTISDWFNRSTPFDQYSLKG